jgi:uncharacterized protein YdhG (YjbR/CyaY superfamily)
VFPFSARVVEAVQDRLSGYALSKGAIRFTPDKPLPDEVVREIVKLRLDEIVGTLDGEPAKRTGEVT